MSEQWLLLDLRKKLDLTQEGLGMLSGIMLQTRISALERGVDEPTPEERDRILNALLEVVAHKKILLLERN